MKKIIVLQYTMFNNLNEDGKKSFPTFGYRVFWLHDDRIQVSNSTYETFEDLKKEVNEETAIDIIVSIKGFEDARNYPIYLNGELVHGEDDEDDEDDE